MAPVQLVRQAGGDPAAGAWPPSKRPTLSIGGCESLGDDASLGEHLLEQECLL